MLAVALMLWLSGNNEAFFITLNHWSNHLPDWLWANLTLMADTLFAVAVLLIAGAFRPTLLSQSLILLVAGAVFVHFFKQTLDISRPAAVLTTDSFHIIGPVLKHHSFPSGHAFTALSCAGLLALNQSSRRLTFVLLLIGLLAAFSRVAVGAHWPLDILAGSGCGLIIAWLAWFIEQHSSFLRAPAWRAFTAILFCLSSVALIFHQSGYPDTRFLCVAMGCTAIAISIWKIWFPVLKQLRMTSAGG